MTKSDVRWGSCFDEICCTYLRRSLQITDQIYHGGKHTWHTHCHPRRGTKAQPVGGEIHARQQDREEIMDLFTTSHPAHLLYIYPRAVLVPACRNSNCWRCGKCEWWYLPDTSTQYSPDKVPRIGAHEEMSSEQSIHPTYKH